MNDFYEELLGESDPIPELLHSEFRKDLFEECLQCERSLQEFNGVYEIQKIFKQNRPIWEHALCSECGEDLMDDYSDSSMQRIHDFMSLLDLHSEDMNACHLCEKTVETGKEHMITALCRGEHTILSPTILCIECLDHMNTLLSDETRDNWNDFIEENVPGLPAAEEPSYDMPVPNLG